MRDRYGQFCPIAKALEIVGPRWTPLVLRELLAGARHFSELQRGLPLIARSLLAQRLREMEEDGLITATRKPSGRGHEYRLTEAGRAAHRVLEALSDWGLSYAQGRITPEDCHPAQMLWAVRRYADRSVLPDRRFVIRFEFRNLPPSRRSMATWWFVWSDGDFDHCLDNPGFAVDLVVNTLIDAFARVWLGGMGLDEAVRSGAMRLDGGREDREIFARMLDLRPGACQKHFTYSAIDAEPVAVAAQRYGAQAQ